MHSSGVESEARYGGVYSDGLLGSVCCRGVVVNVGVCGCMLGVGKDGSLVSSVSCDVCVVGVSDGRVRGKVHPLHWLMCSCVLVVRARRVAFCPFEGLCSPSGSWEGRFEGAPEGVCDGCVEVVRVVGLRVWVLGVYVIVIGCCGRVVSGGV